MHPTGQGGCIFVYTADETTIAHNTVIGAQGCITIAAQKVTGLWVEDNHLEGFVNRLYPK
jgi:nitrous oxidase accessory protein NosD